MKRIWIASNFTLALLLTLTLALPAAGKGETAPFTTSFTRWGPTFTGWSLSGVTPTTGGLQFTPSGAASGTDPAGAFNGRNFYNGGAYFVGEAISPEFAAANIQETIASWNALTPAGTWVETQIRARMSDGHVTKWYNLGVWASDSSTIARHSVPTQGDTDGYVATDTWVRSSKTKLAVTGLQVKVRLFSADGVATPTLYSLGVTTSTALPKKVTTTSAGNPANWGTLLNVPECSQMVYTDGGNVWCSPTSVSMVLGYYGVNPGPCEQRVRDAVEGVYDWVYDGHGNWPFNTAYAAAETNLAYEAYVLRFISLDQVEPWVKAGYPVVFSFAWGKGELDGAAIPSSSGHLAVIVGFDSSGNPIVNDPAASTDSAVQRAYNRAQLESLWLGNSSGSVYLIVPKGTEIKGW